MPFPLPVKPKFHYADFQQNFPVRKVADTNHFDMLRRLRQSPWQVRNKAVCVILMEFSELQRTGKVGDIFGNKVRSFVANTNHESPRHKSWKSATWFVSWTFLICVCDFPSGKFRRQMQSRRNGMWALSSQPIQSTKERNVAGKLTMQRTHDSNF